MDLEGAAAVSSFRGYVETLAARGLDHIYGWQQTWYSALIQDTVDLAVRQACGLPGGLGGVQVNMPPQHGKSTLCAELAPCYGATRNPHLRTMLQTYNRKLSGRSITSAKAIIDSDVHQAISGIRAGRAMSVEMDAAGRVREVSVQAEAKADMLRWLRKRPDGRVERTRGYYLTTSPKGGATGWGYDLGILDDLYKNPTEAYNPAFREWLEGAVRTCFFTRRSPSSAMVQILTRWHALDIGAKMVEWWRQMRIPYVVIELPAIAHDEGEPRPYDPRQVGEPLDTARYGAEFYEQQRATMTDDEWWALYQNRPKITTGAQFLDAHWGRFDPEALRSGGRVLRKVFSIDPNMGAGGGSSFAQIDVAALVQTPQGLEVWKLHEERGKWELADFLRVVLGLAKTWAPDDILIENAAAGGSLLSFLRQQGALGPRLGDPRPALFDGRRPYQMHLLRGNGGPVRVHMLPHGGEAKAVRIEVGSAYVTTGCSKLPARDLGLVTTHWIPDHLAEFRDWPQGRNDDRLDTWTQLVRWAAGECGLRPRLHALPDLGRD